MPFQDIIDLSRQIRNVLRDIESKETSKHDELIYSRKIYVDSMATTGDNDGTSWDNAYTGLVLALDDADTHVGDTNLILVRGANTRYNLRKGAGATPWRFQGEIRGIGTDWGAAIEDTSNIDWILSFYAEEVKIKNIDFYTDNATVSQNCLLISGADGCEIEKCYFELLNAQAGSVGLKIVQAERVLANDNYFYIKPGMVGTEIDGGIRDIIKDNIFDGNHPSVTGGTGILINNTGRQNFMKDNSFIGLDVGIFYGAFGNRNADVGSNFVNCTANRTDSGTDNYNLREASTP